MKLLCLIVCLFIYSSNQVNSQQPEAGGKMRNLRIGTNGEEHATGMKLTVYCDDTNDFCSNEKFVWYKDNEVFSFPNDRIEKSGDNTFIIRSARLEDSGEYTCTVNTTGILESVSKKISVKERVPVKVNLSTQQKQGRRGSNINITCNVDGFPTPTGVKWYKDNKSLPFDNHIAITEGNILEIRGAFRRHSGEYRCVASNQFSNDSQSVTINVTEPATGEQFPGHFCTIQRPENSTIVVYDREKGANLKCNVTGFPKPTIQWYHSFDGRIGPNDDAHSILDDGSLNITHFVHRTKGNYTCVATNDAGDIDMILYDMVEHDLRVEFHVLERNWRIGSLYNMECNVWGYPDTEFHWYKDNKPLQFLQEDHTFCPIHLEFVSTFSLKIHEATEEDSGVYRCEASNGFTNSSQSVEIRVAAN